MPASQLPSWNFRWDPRACCCGEIGPCPCPDHQLPHSEDSPSMRKCGTGGTYVTTVAAPELALPPITTAVVARVERAPMPIELSAPHAAPDAERPRGPS